MAQLKASPLCAYHLMLGQTVQASVADHIEPHRGDIEKFYGGRLQSLCSSCHSAHKQAQEHQADGLLRGAGLDGRPLDAAHPWHRPAASAARGDVKVQGRSPADRSVPLIRTTAESGGGA